MYVDKETAYSGWKSLETYQVPREGITAYPSYDPGARISFQENSFQEACTVSLRVSVTLYRPRLLLMTCILGKLMTLRRVGRYQRGNHNP